MNKKLILITSIVVASVVIILLVMNVIHIAFGAVLLLMVFVVSYSYLTMKERDIPEDIHDSYEEAFVEDEKDIVEDFLKDKTKICPICETENEIHRKYCRKCNNLIQNITCPVCSTKNPHTAKYCSNCDSILQNKTRS